MTATHVTDGRSIELDVRCRRCPNCLKARAAHWRMRAEVETRQSVRSWFGTLTLRPDAHFDVLSRSRLRLASNGFDFDALDAEDRFTERHRTLNPDLTLYMKRLRKESGALLRSICVAEAHKSGLPHYHMLVHEPSEQPIRYKTLVGQWRLGFSSWKLVAEQDPKAAAYVCKYLAKSAISRVRASLGYGQQSLINDDL